MKYQPIRRKISFIAFIFSSIMLGFGFLSLQVLKGNQYLRQSLLYSYSLEAHVKAAQHYKYSKKQYATLQNIRKNLIDNTRIGLLSDVVQSFSAEDKSQLQKRIRKFSQYETRYRHQLSVKLSGSEKHLEEIIVSLITFFTLMIALLPIFLSRQVFSPMKKLAQRMSDFIYSKYTYQMTPPDRTEIGQLHATFNSLAERVVNNVNKLKALDEAKTDFLNIASHELRTPMTSIKGSLSLLSKGIVGQLDSKAQNLINIAEGESDRLIRLINDILDLAKLEANQSSIKPEWVNTHSFVDRTIKGLTGLSQQASVDVIINDQFSKNIEAYVDEDRVIQVLTNFLSNAIKYTEKGCTVRVHCHIVDQSLRIDVVDEGPGIAFEDQEKVFDKFRQISGPNNPLVKGTGLGLAIAKAIVEDHNGTLGLHSSPGRGSTFYFTIPKWRKQLQTTKKTAA